MNDYFQDIMKEEPPEFFVRPKKAEKEQARQAQYQQEQGRQSPFPAQSSAVGTPTTETMRLDLSGAQNQYNGGFPTGQSQPSDANQMQQTPSGISFDLGGTGGIENIQFEDTFEDHEAENNNQSSYEQPQSQQQQQVNREESQSALALLPNAHARSNLSPLATNPNKFSLAQSARDSSPPPILKLSRVHPPTILSFYVRFMRYYLPGESGASALSSSHILYNHTVRSHAISCASDIDSIEVKAQYHPDVTSPEEVDVGIFSRPNTLAMSASADSENTEGVMLFAIKLSNGLNMIQFKLESDRLERVEYYRLYITRDR